MSETKEYKNYELNISLDNLLENKKQMKDFFKNIPEDVWWPDKNLKMAKKLFLYVIRKPTLFNREWFEKRIYWFEEFLIKKFDLKDTNDLTPGADNFPFSDDKLKELFKEYAEQHKNDEIMSALLSLYDKNIDWINLFELFFKKIILEKMKDIDYQKRKEIKATLDEIRQEIKKVN